MNSLATGLTGVTACLLLGSAIGADFDGTTPLICAPTEAVELFAGAAIAKARPRDVGAPSFLRVDIANKKITGPKRVTAINAIERDDKQILLQGTELGFGWTLALDQQRGDMTLSFVDRAGAVVLQGSCTPDR
jgi:hypothetical protein